MAGLEAKREVICTGVEEVDNKLGGGIPVGSLCLIEGDSDSGKSVLCQHLTHGTLSGSSHASVVYYTTENTVHSLVTQMDSLNMFTLDHFLADHLRIYPLSFHSYVKDGRRPFYVMTRHFSRLPKQFKLVIVDSITLLVSHSEPKSIIDFFSHCKNLCDEDRSIILVAHSYAFEEDMLARTRSLCDARFRFKLEQVGDRMIKLMEVLKVRGADRSTGDVVSFDIEPKVGMRIIPFAKARV